MGFKDYSTREQKNESLNINDIDEKTVKSAERRAQHMYNKFKGKSEDELIYELFKNIEKQKQDGTFDYAQICDMAKKVSPFLNADQKKKMNELLEKIK